MKKLFLIFVLIAGIHAQAESPQLPKLFFEYSWLYDSVCGSIPKKEIHPAWAEEAKEREREFAETWEQDGPVFFHKIFEIFGLGFKRKELTATLSACPSPSYSHPLILNVTRFLKSFMGDQPVLSREHFVELVFHELLHNWLVDNRPESSPLLEKYKDENPQVRSHLHLMAIQIMVYQELKRDDLIRMIEDIYKNKRPPPYGRAWQIVMEIEGIEAFIRELKP